MADLDGDGKMEIILGTSLGFIYVLEHDGTVMENFPITMAEVQGQVSAGEVPNQNLQTCPFKIFVVQIKN